LFDFKRFFLGPQGCEAVLHSGAVRVEELVRRPLAAPTLLARVQVAAGVRRHLLLCLWVDILIRPARRLDVTCHRRTELALAVLAPHGLGRALVAVEPLAGALDLAAGLVLLDADTRLDCHQVCVRLHLVGHDRQALERLFCGDLVEAALLLLKRFCLQDLLLVLVDLVSPRNEAWLNNCPLLASRADPQAIFHGVGRCAALAGVDIIIESPERLILIADGHFGCLDFIPRVTP